MRNSVVVRGQSGLRRSVVALAWFVAGILAPAAAQPAPTVDTAAQEIVAVAGVGNALLHVRVFRPPGHGPFPLAVVNHGSPPDAAQRPKMPVPTFASASNWLLARGYLVALPLRRGYGETGGPWAEQFGSCAAPDYYGAGLATADDIQAVLSFFRARAYVARERTLVIGQSAGGWGSIALASRNPRGVQAVLNFAGGRGGMNPQVGNCAPQRLVEAARRYGATARLPSLWLYTANDKYFAPALSHRMFDAFVGAGGTAEYVALPPFGDDGHTVFAASAGRALWQPPADGFLGKLQP
jgi:dienelactone hydrolase